jgi:DNA modification methylase
LNKLYYGDNLQILREHVKDESIDLIYLDPPFNSNANYNVLFKSPTGERSHAQIEAFEDTWHWTDEAEQAFDEVMQSGNTDAAELLRSMRSFLKENDMMAYLTMMAVRLLELQRVLKPTGSLYLHCDPTASHYLKILLDGIFGNFNFKNEIIWKRTSAHSSAKRYGPVHDVILFYGASDAVKWIGGHQAYEEEYVKQRFARGEDRPWKDADLTGSGVRHGETGEVWRGFDVTAKGRHWAYPPSELDRLDEAGLIYWPNKKGGWPRFKKYLDDTKGVPLQDVWTDIYPINSQAQERLGYPTQKPVALLERIISASSDEGDIVLDPFCGCGTSIHAAQKLRREWTGIDITSLAIGLIKDRIRRAFPGVEFETIGMPRDLDGARELASQDKYQFQWWAVQLIPDAHPYSGKNKGADSGIDGLFYIKPDTKTTEKGIISVKGGENVGVSMIRDLAHVVKREKAQMGLFITLAEPTKPMLTEAVKEGFYETVFGKFPRLQIATIDQLLKGNLPKFPPSDQSGFRKAAKEITETQKDLF